jgi:TolB-like protein
MNALRAEIINPKIAEHGGRVVKLMGDGMLAEFGSVVDAVRMATEVQQAVAERNRARPEGERIAFRMGINLGDVIVDGDDIHGDGVNVAARLEGLAEPGGICVSAAVYDQVKSRLDLAFEDLGGQQVKNIDEPVLVWRWTPGASGASARPAGQEKTQATASKPSIVVLPFDNMSGDPEQEYFADGIAEDIITSLSRFDWFLVISRNTSFTYRGVATDARRVADELGVRYVLEGSVRKSGGRVRVTAQLIDAGADHHVWAERYDRGLEDIFAVQDEITERIIGSVAPGIIAAEMQRAHRKDLGSLDAWDRIMRAHWHLARFTMEDSAIARRLLTEAAQIEADSALALGDLAMIHAWEAVWGWGISRDQSLAAAAEAARRAVTIDEGNAWGHIALGMVEMFAARLDEAVRRLERAIELSPNDPSAYGYLGLALSMSGEHDAATAALDEAARLSPRDPFLAVWHMARAIGAFSAERYEEAIDWAKQANEENPQFAGAYRILAACYGRLERGDEAKAAMADLLKHMPGLTIAATRKQVPLKRPEDLERYLDGLRKAGLPE